MKLEYDVDWNHFSPQRPFASGDALVIGLIAAQQIPFVKEESVAKRNMNSD